jgi:hypothetical protein
MAMTLEEESLEGVAVTLEDSVASGAGACADARAQVKIKTRLRWKNRVIFVSGLPKFKSVKKWTLAPYGGSCLKQLELRPGLEVVELRKNAALVGASESPRAAALA